MSSPHSSRDKLPPSSWLERAATWLSAACAVHCLSLPLASALVPLMGTSALPAWGPRVDFVLTWAVVIAAVVAGSVGFFRHRDGRLALAMATAIALYLAGHALESSAFGKALAIIAALGLATVSFLSARASHRCSTHAHGR